VNSSIWVNSGIIWTTANISDSVTRELLSYYIDHSIMYLRNSNENLLRVLILGTVSLRVCMVSSTAGFLSKSFQ